MAEIITGGPEIKTATLQELSPDDMGRFLPGWELSPPNEGSLGYYSFKRVFEGDRYGRVGRERPNFTVYVLPRYSQVSLHLGSSTFINGIRPFVSLGIVEVELDGALGIISFYTVGRKGWYRVTEKGEDHYFKHPGENFEHHVGFKRVPTPE